MSYTVKAAWTTVHASEHESLDDAVRQAQEIRAHEEKPYVYIAGDGVFLSFTDQEPAAIQTA